jgi:hypothetical protein
MARLGLILMIAGMLVLLGGSSTALRYERPPVEMRVRPGHYYPQIHAEVLYAWPYVPHWYIYRYEMLELGNHFWSARGRVIHWEVPPKGSYLIRVEVQRISMGVVVWRSPKRIYKRRLMDHEKELFQ